MHKTYKNYSNTVVGRDRDQLNCFAVLGNFQLPTEEKGQLGPHALPVFGFPLRVNLFKRYNIN